MRVLVTGAGGQLGHDLLRYCREVGDDAVGTTRADLDVGDRDAVRAAVTEIRPNAVINAAAWTAVDACEGDPQRAFRVNAEAVDWLREACADVGAHLVQLSTDYVFDGELDRPYREDDAPNPLSVYGASKLEGERNAGVDATVVRTSWLCGAGGANTLKTVLRLLDSGTPIAFVTDQRGCPTFTADLAPVVRAFAGERRSGVWHVTNQRAVSWYEFVREIVAAAGGDPEAVRPITTRELQPPRPAHRPANSVLDNAALRAAGLPPMRDFAEPMRELVAELRR
jgi:dTDP-4-dehydrorhamnose reductase